MFKSQKNKIVLLSGLILGALVSWQWLTPTPRSQTHVEHSIGNANTLVSAYNHWKTYKISQGKEHSLVLPLTYVKGLSTEYSTAKGHANLDLISGAIEIKVSGLSE